MNKKIFIPVLLIMILSLFLNVYKKDFAPPCFNADEAAFGYNAYSILKTGKDEYGTTLPLRLKSFGDYKMPLYTYLSVPFIGAFGLTESSTRAVNTVLAFFFPLAVFLLANALFKNTKVSLIASFLTAVSMALNIVGRHAHEAYLTAFLMTLVSYLFVRMINKSSFFSTLLFSFVLFLTLFSYQSSRIFWLFFLLTSFILAGVKKIKWWIPLTILLITLAAFIPDLIYRPDRVKTLLFFNSPGFSANVAELQAEGGNPIIYNPLTVGVRHLLFEYARYFSTDFLSIVGDQNVRFGFRDLSLITLAEYIFLLAGIAILMIKKERWRLFILAIFLISPLAGALTWAEPSLTRVLFMFVPATIITAYGFSYLTDYLKENKRLIFIGVTLLFYGVLLLHSWDFYLHHYPKKRLVVRAWQCGYRELADYVKTNYDKYETFFVSKENGQPYIFLLFYLAYPPEKYQKIARLSSPDKYGFGQVEQFDKYVFTATPGVKPSTYALIAYPHDLETYDQSSVKHITVNGEEIFQIFETQR